MNPTYHQEIFPQQLKRELQVWMGKAFERRTVVIKDQSTGGWVLLGCVLRPLPDGAAPENARLDYGTSVLAADWIAAADIREFLGDVANKLCDITGKVVTSTFRGQCERHHVRVRNYWMESPGIVYGWSATEQPNPPTQPLLQLMAPFYPDVHEAAKDWLQLREYSGQSDGRRGSIMLLLPETRAFIESHSWSEDDEHLRLVVAGSVAQTDTISVKGAYWVGKDITQLHERVTDGVATLPIPREAVRLDLHLLGPDGTVYEFEQERVDFPLQSRFLGSRHKVSEDRITQALKAGEGLHTEFKPFVAIPQKNGSLNSSQQAKLDEVLESVVALSNAAGGTVFLGVTNDVRVSGFKADFAKWKGERATKELVESYARELRSHIRDQLYLPVDIDVTVSQLDDEFLVLIEVPASLPRYVSLKKDPRLLRRHGASNRSVPPEEWTPRERDIFGNPR
ncbi:AlbA family DNA-binding domain-containing protein [Ramlibacter humi]|uniref:ATP-binding protein n=1 Tax=Ramlibacter humi TaxID=2530451 RepID=A0A4Z0CD97_9BURK|nr:ATP-binding protein [Ramlibacter humi]TFZ08952.1 ATP-binding protein [Ramlibacter humi]